MDQQGKCSPKHRLFLSAFPSAHSVFSFPTVPAPSLRGQNDYILTETTTSIQQLSPGAKAPFSTTAKKQIHFLTSGKVLLAPAAGANTTCFTVLFPLATASAAGPGHRGHRIRRVKSWLPQRTMRNCHFPLRQQRLLPLNLTGKAAHAGIYLPSFM